MSTPVNSGPDDFGPRILRAALQRKISTYIRASNLKKLLFT